MIELKGQPAGVDATIEANGTAHIAVEAMTGTLERISATGGSEIELKSTATGRTIELRASGTSRLVCNGELLCDDASIESSGAARITTRVKCTGCRIESSGTSATQVSLDATSLHAESSGGAGMTLAGTTRACRIVARGTSRIDATGLKSEQWDTTVGKLLRTQTLTAYETHLSIFYTFHPARSRTGADRRTRPHDQGVGCHAHRNARGRALHGLKVARGVAATIVESDSEKLVVEADEKIIGHVVTTIDKQGVLLLTIDPEIDNIRDCDVRISVPKPEVLQSLTATSGGRVTCRTVVNTPTLNVRTTSGAHAEIACEGDGCTLSATSGSEIKANLAVGRCAIEAHSGAEINVKGSGRGVQNQRHVGSHLQGPQSS